MGGRKHGMTTITREDKSLITDDQQEHNCKFETTRQILEFCSTTNLMRI
jgi:hypothetical protein